MSLTSIVIFGASGDLTHRKLIPGLYNLYVKQRLPQSFQIVGVSRTAFTHEDFREKMREALATFSAETFQDEMVTGFVENLYYVAGNAAELESFHALNRFLQEKEGEHGNRLYYLSTAPSLYEPTLMNLGMANMTSETPTGWRRIIIEKPFGYDLQSATRLNHKVHEVFTEHQVYRIDHYLGKETAQNLLFFRFANSIFEPIWNRNYIDNIQISVLEQVGVGNRAAYYDSSGVIRDMFQNHLLQLLALVAMEPPSSFEADALRNEKAKVLSSMRTLKPEHTVRGQIKGYRELEGVASDSQTATYAALRLELSNWRWEGVPFYLRSGKSLKHKISEIVVQFKRPPHNIFGVRDRVGFSPNWISIRIQPDEGICLGFEAKRPDTIQETHTVVMDFNYQESFGHGALPEAYERLLSDALNGDAALFTRADGIEAQWKIVDPILKYWERNLDFPLETYEAGTWGPASADALLARYGHAWKLSLKE